MTPSPKCIDLIERFEGCRLEAYPDPGKLGWNLPTIGYGHTQGVKRGDVITQEQAEQLLAADVAHFAREVSAWADVPLTQGQFDALVSFAYNVIGWQSSTLLRKVAASDFAGAALEFPKWIHSGKTVLPGLIARRAAEQQLFLS